jgi:hypothetical protein
MTDGLRGMTQFESTSCDQRHGELVYFMQSDGQLDERRQTGTSRSEIEMTADIRRPFSRVSGGRQCRATLFLPPRGWCGSGRYSRRTNRSRSASHLVAGRQVRSIPKPIKLDPRTTCWRVEDIRARRCPPVEPRLLIDYSQEAPLMKNEPDPTLNARCRPTVRRFTVFSNTGSAVPHCRPHRIRGH